MTRTGKLVAAVVGITMFVMPAAAMPLHCILTASSGQAEHPTCHMRMGMNPTADQITPAAPSDHSCCQAPAAKPESVTVPRSPTGKRMIAPPATNGLLSDLPPVAVRHELLARTAKSAGGPPLAVLCTFLI